MKGRFNVHDGMQLAFCGAAKFATEIGGAGGGGNDPKLDLKAMAWTIAPVPLTLTVGAAPLVAFRYKPSPSGRVV